MRQLTLEEKKEIEALTQAYAAKCKTHPTKGKYVFGSSPKTFSGSGQASFSDTGNDSGLLPELAKEREEAAFNDIRRLTIKEAIKTSLTGYIEKRNGQIRAAKQTIKRRFDFRQHESK